MDRVRFLKVLLVIMPVFIIMMADVSFSVEPGDFDLTFSEDGIVTYSGQGWAVAVQSDGKIVATGGKYSGSNYDVLVLRYNNDGTLDTTFGGGDGVVLYSGPRFGDDLGCGVAIQTDGKIVVAGYTWNLYNYPYYADLLLLRYNSDGTPDTTFGGGDGIVTYDSGTMGDSGASVAIQPDGKIVVVGTKNYRDVLLLRYNPDGTLDTTFGGGDGVVTYDSGDYGASVAIQSDGKIVVVGGKWVYPGYDVLVLRYNNDGTLDNTFSGDGVATHNYGGDDYERAVAIQPDGKIVVVGTSDINDVLVLRYNTDGTLDTTFGGGDGVVTYDGGGGGVGDGGYSVVIQPDGKIVVTGQSVIGSTIDLLILRYNTDGTLDTTFGGGDGIVTYDGPTHGWDYGTAIAIQPDGKIIITGTSSSDIITIRLIGSVNTPPIADAGEDQIVKAGYDCLAEVTLDGTHSSDPDGDPLTFTWTGAFGTTTGMTPKITLPLGTHIIALTVADSGGLIATDTVVVTVQDTTLPSIGSLTATPNVLWPPNHKMVSVTVNISASDNCDPNPFCKITSVSSNEPENGVCDGDTAPDWEITGDLTVNLRAERSGQGNGRVYTITTTCTDDSGNSSTGTVNVTVPQYPMI